MKVLRSALKQARGEFTWLYVSVASSPRLPCSKAQPQGETSGASGLGGFESYPIQDISHFSRVQVVFVSSRSQSRSMRLEASATLLLRTVAAMSLMTMRGPHGET